MVFLFILLMIILVIIFSRIRIEIINFKFYSMKPIHTNHDYKIVIKLCIFRKVPILKVTITKLKLDKLMIKFKGKIKNIEMELLSNTNQIDKNFIKAMKKINLSIKRINLNIELGTENAGLTAIIIPLLSTLISIIFRKKVENYNKQFFRISPIYINQNLINIIVSGIFEIKMIHIINIIYILSKKEGVKKNERTSNRRSYDYSYE